MFNKTGGKSIRRVQVRQLSADHQRLIALINSMSDAVLAVSPDGKVQLCNGSALNLFDQNSLIDRDIKEFMKLSDHKGQSFNALSMLDTRFTFNNRDLKLRYSDGSQIDIELNVSPVKVGFGFSDGGFVLLARDITETKSLEEERDEFISVASHELRTPIAIAEGNVGNSLLLAQKKAVSKLIVDSLSAAHDQIIFLGYLINDLSMLSRAQGKNANGEFKTIDVNRLLSGLVSTYTESAHKKKLNLALHVPEESLLLESNELYVREILQNFITNAIKYTKKGGIDISASSTESTVIFEVKDTGFGISKSDQQKLFSKFFRSDDTRIRQSNGTGLGLYVCFKLVKILKGRLEVESELDKGSTFKLVLPAKPENKK